MRKVTLTIKAKILVPLILTYKVTANADDGVPMERIAFAATSGKDVKGATLEDSSIEVANVEGAEDDAKDGMSLDEQIYDYVADVDSPNPQYLSHEVTDSR